MRKIPTVFERDFTAEGGRFVSRRPAVGVRWVFAGEGVATRKWDGTAVRMQAGRWWTRHTVKKGRTAPAGFDYEDADAITGKIVGWIPAESSSYLTQLEQAVRGRSYVEGSYELVGPDINANPQRLDAHELRRHGHRSDIVVLPGRSYDDLLRFFADPAYADWEGLVFWRQPGTPGSELAKTKRRDFRELAQQPVGL